VVKVFCHEDQTKAEFDRLNENFSFANRLPWEK